MKYVKIRDNFLIIPEMKIQRPNKIILSHNLHQSENNVSNNIISALQDCYFFQRPLFNL
jgi:hypothetical protein